MIKSFKHKGLKQYFEKGTTKGLRADHVRKINSILTLVDRSKAVEDFNQLFKCHELKGECKGIYSMTVSGNWRITFKFIDGNAYILNYEDYH
ncbi:type II toxin-antitoxin system RelE/ParE family toxin [Pasteurella atlantica]|uniref:Type II toxin-antitoxin system RelE/ParE family toxin n=2 Tax=Pasteurellaceae TaxID=712 RepID=A0ACC6HPV4_9PAST|nr:type II toxin-antitoxin system RelE/ParE family toxin [Pasteurella atlantica]MDP8032677.1 type II toxin-antitoxin system RelE/ParE family toxin [Pasteurella atlantica]MDP8036489.1 type II toxin-antitoxin system RelE/ParE family toxin [Pasteurella atlantica]MDP8038433.1 type II toxin-antitoxin system RelE/ParE family toxin [Pasteurella atlantica]MDP8048796.1 type II toxin-antitoxin system RelE/ParE family toxin [Pasteurella atlantica]MDP8050042.1 type II toxin-antitoxin system RelE/ParE fami